MVTYVGAGAALVAPVGIDTFDWGTASPLGADLGDGTNAVLRFDILDISDTVAVTLTLDGQSRTGTAASTGLFSFALADFDTTTLTAVDQISLVFTLGTQTDIAFDTVRAYGDAAVVPLPASGWLLLGAFGAVALRRHAKGAAH